MMRKVLLAAAVALLLPASGTAQTGVGVAARAGSLGFGGEAAVGLNRFVGARTGVGALPFSYRGDVEDVRYHVQAASPLVNIGVDLYPGLKDIRFGAGMLFITNPTTFDGAQSGDVQIGSNSYSESEVGTLRVEVDHGSAAPYLLFGMGRQTNRGLGIFLDLGAAFLKEQRVTMTATGTAASSPQFQADLASESQQIEDTVNKYLKVYPILSAGLRFGFGF